MDQQVLAAQKHLNSTYRGRAGYVAVAENGVTGAPTLFAITRALQIELGIAEPSNNFGSGTSSAFTTKVGAIGKDTKASIVALLSCALWCKGYSGDTIGRGWTATIQASVGTVRRDVGLAVTPATVDAKLMKALLTTDPFTLQAGGTKAIRAGQQWLNSRYAGRQDFVLTPTDGRYARQTQTNLIFAVQYEIGLADGVANGNFGPATQAGIKEQALIGSGSKDGAKAFVRILQLLLVCNGFDAPQNGTFDTATVSAARDFEELLAVDRTGRGDFGTWAALLASTGDPDRAVTGMDAAQPQTVASAKARYAEGYRTVGRYLTVTGKAVVPGELPAIFGAGLRFFPIFQNFNDDASYFTRSNGLDHGRQAATRARELGLGATTIFFAVDYDATGDEASSIVLDYFGGVRDGLASSLDVTYRAGVYGSRNVCSIVSDKGLAAEVWVSDMSTAYSGNLGFRMPASWSYNQIKELTDPPLDRNAVSSRARPLTSSLEIPLKGDAFDPLYWGDKTSEPEVLGLMKLQVLAERFLRDRGVRGKAPYTSTRLASEMVMFFLAQGGYAPTGASADGLRWSTYTPRFEAYRAVKADRQRYANLARARDEFFAAAGSPKALDPAYSGALHHAAGTAHGVLLRGDHVGARNVNGGDLGGWALDTLTLWNDYRRSGADNSITAYVESHLGRGQGSFGAADLQAVADGWLAGRYLRAYDTTFGEAWRRILLSSPEQRVSTFIRRRFGTRPGSAVAACVRDLFLNKVFRSVYGFERGTILTVRTPTRAQVDELARAMAARFTELAE